MLNEKFIPEKINKTIYVDDIKCKNLFNKNSIRRGYLGDNGVIITGATDDRITPYINIYPNTSYIVSGLANSYSRAAAYDENKNYISELLTNVSGYTRTFITPSNAKYIVFSVANYSDSKLIQIEPGSEATSYTEHKEFENNELYSENETRIGTWVNGKPLYRKVLTGTLGTSGLEQIGNISGVDMFVNLHGVVKSNTYFQPLDYWSDNTKHHLQANTSTGNITLYYGSYSNNANYYVIVEYTKTTD